MDYELMRAQMRNVAETTDSALKTVCQRNIWLRDGGIPFEDDPFLELDSPYSFWQTDSLAALQAYFDHGNWSIRNGIVYHDLAFINQINGGDEWWTLKRFGKEWVDFESITFKLIIQRGEFDSLIERLERATYEQCKELTY